MDMESNDRSDDEENDLKKQWKYFCENELQTIQDTWNRKLVEDQRK
jgi:hypothetical protein